MKLRILSLRLYIYEFSQCLHFNIKEIKMQNNNKKIEITQKDIIEFIKNPKGKVESEFSKKMIKDTEHYQKKYGFDSKEGDKTFSTHNNEADAFKHTYMQAWLTANIHEQAAKKLGDMHENDGNDRNQPSGEENMDLWNNNQGREIGLEVQAFMKKYNVKRFTPEVNDYIAKKVMERMKAGKLITHPSDPRRYVPKNKKGTTTGQAAPISNSIKSAPITQPTVKSDKPKTSSQNFSDMIRQKYKNQQNKSNENFRQIFSRHSSSYNTENGHWVTMNGAHVFIEDK